MTIGMASAIKDCVEYVTRKWTKQRKAEERGSARARKSALTRRKGITYKDAAYEVMPEAFMKASSDGRYPASARQIFYQARPLILAATVQAQLDSQYFTQRLLQEYMAENERQTADWDVTYDARGSLIEPHTNVAVPLGTLGVRSYLASLDTAIEHDVQFELPYTYPTRGPRSRYSAVLFIEKEGFWPLFRAAKLAERYDLCIMSTKGMPVVACRELVDEICGLYGIPLLVLHDFDKAGFSILETLSRGADGADRMDAAEDGLCSSWWPSQDSGTSRSKRKRYCYRHEFEVIDLGLRLNDVRAYNLESEPVTYGKGDPRDNLRRNGATREEADFLCQGKRDGKWFGQRVELNAFASADFIRWIEAKLQEHGIRKVIPDDDTLNAAYQRAMQIAMVNRRLPQVIAEAGQDAKTAPIPRNLVKSIEKQLQKHPEQPWDKAMAALVAKHMGKQG